MLNIEKETYRHWCPFSETITGGDVLESMLDQGWQFSQTFCQRQDYALRCAMTSTYSFWLQRGLHIRRVTVVSNPYVLRLIDRFHLRVVNPDQPLETEHEHQREGVAA